MSWFFLALIALLFWSGSDFFSKLGSHPDDKNSHFKMVAAVGLCMGLHAIYSIAFGGVSFYWGALLEYLPASLLYIGAMVFGYVSLRYIELSVSSPVCNASGAVAAIFCFVLLDEAIEIPMLIGIFIVCFGVVFLGVVQMTEDKELHELRQKKATVKYTISLLAIVLPILYCLIDAAGTVADTLIMDSVAQRMGIEQGAIVLTEEGQPEVLNEDLMKAIEDTVAGIMNVAYEFTFLFIGCIACVYLLFKKEKPKTKWELPKLCGAVCETGGQLAYIYAISAYPVGAAPVISAYCMLSAVWSHIFLKERLSFKHYIAIGIVIAGIVFLGVLEGFAE